MELDKTLDDIFESIALGESILPARTKYTAVFPDNLAFVKFVDEEGDVIDPGFLLSLLAAGTARVEYSEEADGSGQVVSREWTIIPSSPPPAETPE